MRQGRFVVETQAIHRRAVATGEDRPTIDRRAVSPAMASSIRAGRTIVDENRGVSAED